MLKFTGDFKELIPMGFKFHKLFASNYKVYEKNKVWIWVAHGGYVEIDDHYDNSKYIAKAIIEGTYPVYERDYECMGRIFYKKGNPKGCMINRKTGEIIDRIIFKHEHGNDYDDEIYRELLLYKKTFHFIKEIKKMLDISF